VEKAGLDDEIRDGYEYEMTLAFEIINDKHMARASKDRTEQDSLSTFLSLSLPLKQEK
jgi:hypothetical protein